jgi:hypothetical protein
MSTAPELTTADPIQRHENPLCAAALAYASDRGWPVFPCNPNNKKPRTEHGFKDATTDPQQIRDWWRRWPNAMIGVPTGQPSGFWAVDPDVPKDADSADGRKAWNELVALHGIPPTRTHSTPSGGQHVLFRWRAEKPVSTSRGNLPKGIDIRGTGGYVVVPPSRMSSGRAYSQEGFGEIAEAPDWLYAILEPRAKSTTPAADRRPAPPDWLAKLMEQDAGKGLSREADDLLSPPDQEAIEAALRVVSSDPYQTWFEIGCAIYAALGDTGFAVFDAWSRKSSKYDALACVKKWSECKKINSYTAGTIFHYANSAEPGWRSANTEKSAPQGEPVGDSERQANGAAEKDDQVGPKAAPKAEEKPNKARLVNLLKRSSDLQMQRFAPLRWIVPRYVPEGQIILAGRPKIGKSWLGLDIATAVASGGTCMGQRCEEGDVLALFLEDNDRRLQRRMTAMLGAQKQNWPARLEYATRWLRLAEGGLELIREWVRTREKPRLIIVDILQRVRSAAKSKETQYTADYEALAALQQLAGEAELSILVLHHQRKATAEDPIDTVSGTLGLSGAADATLILDKNDHGKFVYGRGRDIEEFSVAVQQDENSRWQVTGRTAEVHLSAERSAVLTVLKKTGRPMSVQEISEAVGGKRQNLKALLHKMHYDDELERVSVGVYAMPKLQAEMDLPGDAV